MSSHSQKRVRRKNSADGLSALCKLSTAVVETGQYENILQRILDITKHSLKIDACSIRLLNERSGALELVAFSGIPEHFPGVEYYSAVMPDEGHIGRAVMERRIVTDTDITHSNYMFPGLAEAGRFRSLLAVPIIFRNRVLGGMTIYYKKQHAFSRIEKELVTAIVSHAAIAIYNTSLYQDSISTIHILAKAIESKDTFTKGHSDRVTEYAVMICYEIGLSDTQTGLVREICPLHDIGKVGISERILQKKGALTVRERSVVCSHPLIGCNILNNIKIFRDGIAIVRNHHEWFNGKGYPDRLAGMEIPLLARITAVADAFDAMTSHRPYRKALTLEKARQELLGMSGIQFDAALAAAFLKAVRRNMPRVLRTIKAAQSLPSGGNGQ